MALNRRHCLKGLAGGLALGAGHGWTAAVAQGDDTVTGPKRQLRFTLTMRNPSGDTLTDQTVWMYLPLKDSATQHLSSVRVSMPHQLSADPLGHSLLRLQLPSLAAFSSKVATVQCEVALRAEPLRTPAPAGTDWLTPERWIECDDAQVRALAMTLKQDTTGKTLDAIYEWVSGQLTYAGYLADPIGARQALVKRSGDCTEYAYLCTALARALGIPARPVGGYVVSSSAAPRAEDYHDWIEVYVDGSWRVMDAQKGCWRDTGADYIGFRIHRPVASNALGLATRFKVDGSVDVRI